MRILAIETSCDETAAAIVDDGRRLISNVVQSQIDIHKAFGGVVPEVAARSHIEVMLQVIDEAIKQAHLVDSKQLSVISQLQLQKTDNRVLTTESNPWDQIDAIAVTYAPGLIGSLLIGTLTARTLAIVKNKPLIPVHHVEGHVYANFLTEVGTGDQEMGNGNADKLLSTPFPISQSLPPISQPLFPLLALIVSGGHTQLVLFNDHKDYRLLGQTQDDAVGEAFDKVAKVIGLPYPGGPSIAKAAKVGDAQAYNFPKAKLTCSHSGTHSGMDSKAAASSGQSGTFRYREGAAESITQLGSSEVCHYYDFSFSGLKTAVLRRVQAECGVGYDFPSSRLPALLSEPTRNNFAASFQKIAVETLVDKVLVAFEEFQPASVVIAGGVAANQALRLELSRRLPIAINYAPPNLCTDNAAMIGALGYYNYEQLGPSDPYSLSAIPSLSM